MNLAVVVFALFGLVFGTVAFLGIKNRLLGRLALREGVRRPGQTALVVGGLMVGAAAITAAAIGVDSARDSAVSNAYRSWGAVDLTISASDEVFPSSLADTIRDDPALSGSFDGVQPGIELFGSVVNKTKEKSDAGVRMVSFDPATQEAFGAFQLTDGTSTTGADLGAREVFVSRQLADELDVEVGDELKMGLEPLEEPDPTPKQLGNHLKAIGKRLQALQKRAQDRIEDAATAAAERAGKAAAEAEVRAITSELEAQGQAAAAAYLAQIAGFKDYVKDTIKAAKLAEKAAGLPPGSIPPFLAEPTPPPPPAFGAPDPTAIEAQVAAVAQAAAEQAAKETAERLGDKVAKKADRLVDQLDDLKDQLDDTIENLKPVKLRVAGIAKAEGPGAYGLTSAVFVPLPLAQDMANTQAAGDGAGGVNVIRVSGVGDDEAGLLPATDAIATLRSAVEAANADIEIDGDAPLEVNPVKADEIDSARDSSEFTVAMLGAMSALVLAAGVALVINLTQMLADERRPRLAILRAMGLTRRGLIMLSTIEGAFYSLLAAAVGTFLGIFAGRVLAERFGKAFAEFFSADVDYRFSFSLHWQTLAVAFAAGALVTLVTVFFAAVRTSRMSIPSAIRNLPEPPKQRVKRGWIGTLVRIALLVLGAVQLAGPVPIGRLFGGVIVIVVIARWVKGRVPERARATVQGVALASWAFFMVWQVSGIDDPNVFFAVFTNAVIVAVIGLSLATAANLRILERGITGAFGLASSRLRADLTPPMAYLSRRTSRTGLSIMMFAVVMAIISMSSVFLYIFQPDYEADSKGYDLVVTTAKKEPTKLPEDVAATIEQRADIRTRVYTGSMGTSFQDFERIFAPLYELTDEQFADPPLQLSARDDTFADDEAVFEAVRTNPKYVISNFGQPGDEIELEDDHGNPVVFTIAGSPAVGLFQGVVGPASSFEQFDTNGKGYTSLLSIRGNQDVQGVADKIEAKKYEDGVTTEVIRELMERGYRANRTFFSVIDVLMRMGLVVGILSLGILGLRAVVERRHLIGVLRAIGFYKRSVMGGLLVEAFTTTTLGVLVGVLAGFGMGYIFFISFFERATFGVDRENMWSAIILVFVAVLLVTIGPAWRASRLPPAEAVRYTE